MRLVPPAPLSKPVPGSTSGDNQFFKELFEHCYQYLEAERYAQEVLVVPRFSNGDLLLVRMRSEAGFSVEFPKGSVHTANCPQANALNGVTQTAGFAWSARTLLRLGALRNPRGAHPLDVFLLAAPSTAASPDTSLEAVDLPLRVPEVEFRRMIDRAEVTDGHTLAAYALLLSRQAMQTFGSPLPLLDRRKPQSPVRLVP